MTTEIKSTQTARIRALNDELRKDFNQGHAVMTMGIAALGAEAVARIVKTIEVYDDFCHENDPYEEHDFGSFKAEGHTIFFKIDYYDSTLTVHSPDPSDPSITKRVITVPQLSAINSRLLRGLLSRTEFTENLNILESIKQRFGNEREERPRGAKV